MITIEEIAEVEIYFPLLNMTPSSLLSIFHVFLSEEENVLEKKMLHLQENLSSTRVLKQFSWK